MAHRGRGLPGVHHRRRQGQRLLRVGQPADRPRDQAALSAKAAPAAVLVVLAAVLWGTTGTAQELGPDDIDPLVVGWVRLAVGGLGLVAVAVARRARAAALPRVWLVTAVASVAAYQLTFFGGVRLAGVALGTAVGIGSAPIWGGLVDWHFAGTTPSRRWFVAAASAIAGAVLVAGEPGDAERPGLGLVLAVGAGAVYALYSYALQQIARAGDADRVAAVTFVSAAVVLAPVTFLVGGLSSLEPLATGRGAAMALHLGLVATTLSYALFTRGVRDTPVATATLLSLAEPMTAVLLGVTVIGEDLTAASAAGVALLLVGVTVAALDRRPSRRASPATDVPV
ncbi:MAG TPA: EamA family transporter [Acidimicrobiales bacterium]|nr:EamA family transporter [Acidimicrobiales bacterium]